MDGYTNTYSWDAGVVLTSPRLPFNLHHPGGDMKKLGCPGTEVRIKGVLSG